MHASAQLAPVEMRSAARYPVEHSAIGHHRRHGDVPLLIANVSANGFMATSAQELERGDRISIRLPVIGGIEAYVVWTAGDRAGFKLERVIRAEDFAAMLAAMQPSDETTKRKADLRSVK